MCRQTKLYLLYLAKYCFLSIMFTAWTYTGWTAKHQKENDATHIAEVYDKHLIFLHKAQKDVLYAAILATEDKKIFLLDTFYS